MTRRDVIETAYAVALALRLPADASAAIGGELARRWLHNLDEWAQA